LHGAIARSGLPYHKPHNLRHTTATIMVKRGLTVGVVSRILGHCSIVLTIDTSITMNGFRRHSIRQD